MNSPSDQPASAQPRAGRELVTMPIRQSIGSDRYLRKMAIVGLCVTAAAALGWGAGAHMGGRQPAVDPLVAEARKAENERLAQDALAAQRKEAQRREAERQEIRQLGEDVHALKDGLAGLQTSLGRSRQADVVVNDPNVSREHAEIRPRGGSWVITDLGSTNGSQLNGRRIDASEVLRSGDEIELGASLMTFTLE